MEPIYLGDLVPSIASSKKIIEKYYKGIKEGGFYEDLHKIPPPLYLYNIFQ